MRFCFLACLLALLGVVPAAWFAGRFRRWTSLPAAVLSAGLLLGIVVAGGRLATGASLQFDFSKAAPFLFALNIDRLSAFFLFLICGVALPVVLYSRSYLPRHYSHMRTQWIWALCSLFLLSMVLVVTASTAFSFVMGWELMTLLSAALILVDGTSRERLHNVFIYLVYRFNKT